MGPAHWRERVQNTIWFSSTSIQGGFSCSCWPWAGSGHGTSRHSLEEGGHRISSSSLEKVWILQTLLHRSEEGWGVASHFRSASAVPLSHAAEGLVWSEDWFVRIDLRDAYFHVSILPHHRKFLRFAFGGEAYQYRVLPFGLALSHHTFATCVDAALAPLRLQGIRILSYIDDWLILAQSEQRAESIEILTFILAHMKELNTKKSVLSQLQRTTYLGVVWNSTTMQARLSPARIESILSAVKRERRPVTHCKAVSETIVSDGSCVQRDTFWPAVHEALAVVAQDQRLFLEGQPISHNQGHVMMLTGLTHVEETMVPVTRPSVGGSLSSCNSNNWCLPYVCAHFINWHARSFCGLKGNWFTSLGISIWEQTSFWDRGWGPGNGDSTTR